MHSDQDDPLNPHYHDPNYTVPSGDGSFTFEFPDGDSRTIEVNQLHAFPYTELQGCYIVSTGHGTTGPFRFGGVRLLDFIEAVTPPPMQWQQVEIISADGFGNRVLRYELQFDDIHHPPLLAFRKDGNSLTRADGLVRLIVPTEQNEALRQGKWVETIRIR